MTVFCSELGDREKRKVVDQLDGMTIDYTVPGGLRFVVRFNQRTASYWAVDEAERISNRQDHIPYRCREIRPGLVFAICYEQCIGDVLSLIIDLHAQKVYSGALTGYPSEDRRMQFEEGVLNREQFD